MVHWDRCGQISCSCEREEQESWVVHTGCSCAFYQDKMGGLKLRGSDVNLIYLRVARGFVYEQGLPARGHRNLTGRYLHYMQRVRNRGRVRSGGEGQLND